MLRIKFSKLITHVVYMKAHYLTTGVHPLMHQYKIYPRNLEKIFHLKIILKDWQDVYFVSRDKDIKLNGWLLIFPNRPIIIVTQYQSTMENVNQRQILLLHYL